MNSDTHFRGIWQRLQRASPSASASAELIQSWATKRGLDVKSAENRAVGRFNAVDGVVLTLTDGKQAFFPTNSASKDQAWARRNERANKVANLWEKVEWFSPFWVPMGRVSELLTSIEGCSKERAIEQYDYHTSTIYTVHFQAMCITQAMQSARSLQVFCPLARESYLAFYSGYRASSISALIPVIEGAITRISDPAHANLSPVDKVDRIFDRVISRAAALHFDRMWVPEEFCTADHLLGEDEIVFCFQTFRAWLKQSFFQRTDNYDGATWLNRHLFAHGAATDWQKSSNFSRLIVALATLGVVEGWHDETDCVSLFWPAPNEDSKLLWQQALFQANAQMHFKLTEREHYERHGRLVPEMPTDNGVTLRSAILSEDCINDLVRPLREAGWAVEVDEPDERALYMTVAASAGEQRLRAALLYSCATDNELYRTLAKTCDAILYRGAPYKQSSFAYGIDVHVGPVTGWQPPRPSH